MQHKYNSNAIQIQHKYKTHTLQIQCRPNRNTTQIHSKSKCNNVLHFRGRWKQLKDRPNTGEPRALPLWRGIDMLTCFQDPDQWHMGSCMEFVFPLSTELYLLIWTNWAWLNNWKQTSSQIFWEDQWAHTRLGGEPAKRRSDQKGAGALHLGRDKEGTKEETLTRGGGIPRHLVAPGLHVLSAYGSILS